MQEEELTTWYVLHTGGKVWSRLKKKPSENDVHGGAGSVSNEFKAKDHSFHRDRIDNISVIRFTKAWAQHHEDLLKISFTLDEFKAFKAKKELGPGQKSLGEFLGVN